MVSVKPQWVMVGFPATPDLVPAVRDNQVAILASTRLTRAELEYTVRHYEFRDWMDFSASFKPHKTLAVEFDDFVVVVADTYPEALKALLSAWTPSTASAIERKFLGG